MNFLFPVASAVLQATSFVLDKIILSSRRVSFVTYSSVSFPLMFLITSVVFLVVQPPLSFALFAGNLKWLLLFSVMLAVIGNLVFYRALDSDRLGEIQTFELLRNVPIILFSSLIFADERNAVIIVLGLIASLVVAWSHWEHHHFRLVRTTWHFVLWSWASAAVSAPMIKMLLVHWHPVSFELVRSGAIMVLLAPWSISQIKGVSRRVFLLLCTTNLLTWVAWILFYFSYQRLGVVYTTLIFSLQPLLVYLASVFFLRERVHWKKAAAFAVVLLSIVAAQAFG